MKNLFRVALLIWIASLTSSVWAHANLDVSFPTANAQIPFSPSEIRLWFTEPLEPSFSQIKVIDRTGTTLPLTSVVEAVNPNQMVIYAPNLADGLYTVNWRAVSATDGHTTKGSYAFVVGLQHEQTITAPVNSFSVPIDSSLVRWLNLLSFSALGGILGFYLFAWRNLSLASGDYSHHHNPFVRVLWIAWVSVGITGFLMLVMQVLIYADIPLSQIFNADWNAVITQTRFGGLWLARMGIWLVIGVCLFLTSKDKRVLWLTFVAVLAILVVQSLFSHAVNVSDGGIAIISDWLHLSATVFWMGGLLAFLVIIPYAKRTVEQPTLVISQLVAYFSNYARVCVIVLIITGVYASYVQVGSLEALQNTAYGTALIVKWVLFIPLLAIAGINLWVTGKRLRKGTDVWVGRLRGLVMLEITLITIILVAVGVMTSINPANTQYELQLAQKEVESSPYFEMQMANEGIMTHLEVTPNEIGENTFIVSLYDENNVQITDATLIRMRFENKQAGTGRSELRPELQSDGTYQVTGSNLSLTGTWTVRITVQRPKKFDAIVDYVIQMGE